MPTAEKPMQKPKRARKTERHNLVAMVEVPGPDGQPTEPRTFREIPEVRAAKCYTLPDVTRAMKAAEIEGLPYVMRLVAIGVGQVKHQYTLEWK